MSSPIFTQNKTFQVIASHGLGNQLFQYSFAHYLHFRFGIEVLFENSPKTYRLASGGNLSYELAKLKEHCCHLKFKTNPQFPINNRIGEVVYMTGLMNALHKYLTKQKNYHLYTESEKSRYQFAPIIEPYVSTSFSGIWQHYKYSLPHRAELFSELMNFSQVQTKGSKVMHKYGHLLDKKNTIRTLAIHIRRGDFKLRANDKSLGVISEKSYVSLIKKIKDDNPDLNIFTFTDDDKLLEEFQNRELFGTILGMELSPLETLSFMARTNFLITANSSLSWWAAFLNFNNGGKVFTPKKFYRSIDTYDAFNYPGFGHFKSVFI